MAWWKGQPTGRQLKTFQAQLAKNKLLNAQKKIMGSKKVKGSEIQFLQAQAKFYEKLQKNTVNSNFAEQ